MSPLAPGVVVGVSLLVLAMIYVDIRVCGERLLFANLGISRTRIALSAFAVAGVLESALLLTSVVIARLTVSS